jgi:hypothetical protein
MRMTEGASLPEPLLGAPLTTVPHLFDRGTSLDGLFNSALPTSPVHPGVPGPSAVASVRAVRAPGANDALRVARPNEATDRRPRLHLDPEPTPIGPAIAAAPPASPAADSTQRTDPSHRRELVPARRPAGAPPMPRSPMPGATSPSVDGPESSRDRAEPTRTPGATSASPSDEATRPGGQPERARGAPVWPSLPEIQTGDRVGGPAPDSGVHRQQVVPASSDPDRRPISPASIHALDPSGSAQPSRHESVGPSEPGVHRFGAVAPSTPASNASPARAHAVPDQLASPASPTIEVTIGRIEVRGATPPARPTRPRWSPPNMTLGDYLDRRAGKDSG